MLLVKLLQDRISANFLASLPVLLGGTLLLALILRKLSGNRRDGSSLSSLSGPESPSFLLGHLPQLFDKNTGLAYHDQITTRYGRAIRLKGLFGADALYISDPRALTMIMSGDEFYEHPSHVVCCLLAFGPGLLSSHGNQHKRLRRILNPVFTTHHMQQLVPIFMSVAEKLRDAFLPELEAHGNSGAEIDVLSWLSRTALELIGQGGLGYSFKALDVEEDAYGSAAGQLMSAYAPFRLALLLLPSVHIDSLTSFMPGLQRRIVDLMPVGAVQRLKNIIDVLSETTTEILDQKAAALAHENDLHEVSGHGKDIMSVILKANANATADTRLDESEVRAIVSELVFSAHETTSGAIARTLSVLASHPDVQSQLRKEIQEAKQTNSDLDFAAIERLKLLDAVCKETLRLHPPVTAMSRVPVKDTVIPIGSEKGFVRVPKGTSIFCAIRAVNRDLAIWGPDAAEWIPERWLRPLPDTVAGARLPGVFSSLMTFLGGKRACIGYKFAILEMKTVLLTLIDAYEFRAGSAPLEWDFGMTLTPHPVGQETAGLPLKVRAVERA